MEMDAGATPRHNFSFLHDCKFEDEEAVQVLVNNIRAERGPKSLDLDLEQFNSLNSPERLGERWSFL
jgi:hypothetical protein